MGKFIRTTVSPPLCVRSKLLCFSLLYLFTTLSLFLYVSLSRNQCVFQYSPFDPIQTKLFSYPYSYGEHKYALPTHRSSCSSPVFFSEYWRVLKEIQSICSNSSSPSNNLKYINGRSETFGGNFSTQKRFSYFNHSNIDVEVPCGFFRDFPISKSVVPEVDIAISKHPFFVNTMEEAMATARWKKWSNVDELRMQMETYCENGFKPWSSHKSPYPTDVPDTALILRRHGTRSNLFSCFMFNELEAFNPRDQLAFAFVRDHINPKVKMNMFEVEVFEQIVVEYRHNLKKTQTSLYEEQEKEEKQRTIQKSKRWFDHEFLFPNNSKCKSYLVELYGETHH